MDSNNGHRSVKTAAGCANQVLHVQVHVDLVLVIGRSVTNDWIMFDLFDNFGKIVKRISG